MWASVVKSCTSTTPTTWTATPSEAPADTPAMSMSLRLTATPTTPVRSAWARLKPERVNTSLVSNSSFSNSCTPTSSSGCSEWLSSASVWVSAAGRPSWSLHGIRSIAGPPKVSLSQIFPEPASTV